MEGFGAVWATSIGLDSKVITKINRVFFMVFVLKIVKWFV